MVVLDGLKLSRAYSYAENSSPIQRSDKFRNLPTYLTNKALHENEVLHEIEAEDGNLEWNKLLTVEIP